MADTFTSVAEMRVVVGTDNTPLFKGLVDARNELRQFATEGTGLMGVFDKGLGGVAGTIETVKAGLGLFSASATAALTLLSQVNDRVKMAFESVGRGSDYAEYAALVTDLATSIRDFVPNALQVAVTSLRSYDEAVEATGATEDEYIKQSRLSWSAQSATVKENLESMIHQLKRWSDPEQWNTKTAEQELLHLQSLIAETSDRIEKAKTNPDKPIFDLKALFGQSTDADYLENLIGQVRRASDLIQKIRETDMGGAGDVLAAMEKDIAALELRTKAREMDTAAAEAFLEVEKRLLELGNKNIEVTEAAGNAIRERAQERASLLEAERQFERDKRAGESVKGLERDVESAQRRIAALDMETQAGEVYVAVQDRIAKMRADGVTITDELKGSVERLTAAQIELKHVEANRRQDAAQDIEIAERDTANRERLLNSLQREVDTVRARADTMALSTAAQAGAVFEQRALNDARLAGIELDDSDLAAIRDRRAAIEELTLAQESYRYNLATMQAVTSVATRSMEQAFRQWTNGSVIDTREMVRSILAELALLSLKRGVLEPVSNALTGQGGILSSLIAGFRADGGPVDSGLPYVVGERGPELFMPSAPGYVIPNEAVAMFGGRGGGGNVSAPMTVVINAQGAYPESIADIRQAVAGLEQSLPGRVVAHVTEAKQRGMID